MGKLVIRLIWEIVKFLGLTVVCACQIWAIIIIAKL